ncbi:MAG: hypothetical protein K6B15_07695 [Parasporobacterium sp.]|nr:hypothetical protein [Parasporobacterium sp.]
MISLIFWIIVCCILWKQVRKACGDVSVTEQRVDAIVGLVIIAIVVIAFAVIFNACDHMILG